LLGLSREGLELARSPDSNLTNLVPSAKNKEQARFFGKHFNKITFAHRNHESLDGAAIFPVDLCYKKLTASFAEISRGEVKWFLYVKAGRRTALSYF
jgi:hypothetical protein